jgi:hypothetical protein
MMDERKVHAPDLQNLFALGCGALVQSDVVEQTPARRSTVGSAVWRGMRWCRRC